MTIPFGKYRGKSLSEVPVDYLLWLTTIKLRERLEAEVREEIKWRTDKVGGDAAVRAAAERIVERGFRSLAVESHPDHLGGSNNRMLALNLARARLVRSL